MALTLQVGRAGTLREIDAHLAQDEAGVEGDEASVAGKGRDAAGADLYLAGEALLGEHALEHLLRDDAAARVRVANEEHPPLRRRILRAHSPPAKISPMPSGAVMPFASSSFTR